MTAIANYTTRVVDTSLSAEQIQEALKFIGMCFSLYPFTFGTEKTFTDHVRGDVSSLAVALRVNALSL